MGASEVPRVREYRLVERGSEWGDQLEVEGAEMIAVSDGSLRQENLSKVCASRIVGTQGIAKAEHGPS